MTESKFNNNNSKDKIIGEIKKSVGKITDNEQLELEGRVQSAKSDLKDKMSDIDSKINEINEGIAGKINSIIEKEKENMKNK